MSKTLATLSVLAVGLTFSSIPAVAAGSPETALVSVGVTQDVTRTTVVFSGTVNPEGSATSYRFVYIDQAGYDAAIAASSGEPYADGSSTSVAGVGSESGEVAVGPQLAGGLLPGTTYHYALVAVNAAGRVLGPDATFTTAAATPPVAVTGGASAISQNDATIAAAINTHGLQTNYGFEIGTSTSYGPPTGLGGVGAGASEAPVALSLTGLVPGTTYHYRIEATSIDGTSLGADQTFTTTVFPNAFVTPPAPLPFVATPTVAFPSAPSAASAPSVKKKATKKAGRKHGKHTKGKRQAGKKKRSGKRK